MYKLACSARNNIYKDINTILTVKTKSSMKADNNNIFVISSMLKGVLVFHSASTPFHVSTLQTFVPQNVCPKKMGSEFFLSTFFLTTQIFTFWEKSKNMRRKREERKNDSVTSGHYVQRRIAHKLRLDK